MHLTTVVVPSAGPFRQGAWTGRELVVVQRRWFPAIICWLIAFLSLGWVGAAIVWPKSEYVPESHQFGALELIGGMFLLAGVALALWRRSWIADPHQKSITYRSGFLPARSATSDRGLWLQIHPIRVAVRGALGWSGHATVLHASSTTGVVLAAISSEVEAQTYTKSLAETFRVPVLGEPGAALSATT